MKILIVSAYFPPQNSIASLRPYSWAKYWSQWGHDMTVLTTPKPPAPSNSPMPCDGFRVLEIPVPGFYPIRSFLRKLDWQQASAPDVVAVSPNQNLSGRSFSRLRHWTTAMRLRYGVFNLCRMPEFHDLWAIRCIPVVSQERWDAVVSTGGPYSTHIVGHILKRRKLTQTWVVDWRDLWTDNHIYPGLPGFRILERLIEQSFHRHCDSITTVSKPLANRLRTTAEDKVHVVYNGFDPDDYASLPAESIFPADAVFRIVYTGTIYPGKQDPTPLFRAIGQLHASRKLSPEQLQVIFAGFNTDMSALARQEGVEQYVQYAGFVPRQDALRMQRDADALLFLEFEAPGVEGVLTGKLFEYLFAEPPILAIGISQDSAAGRIIEKAGRGRAYGKDTEQLSLDLLQMMDMRVRGKQRGSAVLRPEIQQFSRAQQARNLLALISTA